MERWNNVATNNNGIGITIQTNFDFKNGQKDLELALQQMQQNIKLGINLDVKGLENVSKYTETTAKGTDQIAKKVSEYNNQMGTTIKLTEELNKKTKEWEKSSSTTYDTSKMQKHLDEERKYAYEANKYYRQKEEDRLAITTDIQKRIENVVVSSNKNIDQLIKEQYSKSPHTYSQEQSYDKFWNSSLAQEEQKTQQLQEQLKLFKQQKEVQLNGIDKQYKNVGDTKQKVSDLRDTVNSLTTSNGKLIDSTTGAETSFANINKQIGIVEGTAKNSIGIFNKIRENIMKFANWFLIGGLVVGAKRFFTDMFSTINQFDKQLTDIRIVTGETKASVDSLAISYNKLGQQIGATTSEIMSGSVEWIRQGKSFAETQELVQASIMQSKLAGIEAGQSTEYLTAVLNGYQLDASKATSVIDKMVAVDNAAATSVAEISEALQRCSNSASQAGVSIDKLISYVGTVSSVTRKSAESIGESFKTMFTRMNDIKLNDFVDDGIGIAQVEEVMNKVGVKIKENETTFRDFGSVIEDLSGKWSTLNDVEKAAVSKALAG